jgi:hypothetical protein
VGNNPNSVASVPRADGTSRNNNRPRFVADAFQVSKTIVERHRDEPSNVLTKHPAGPGLVNNADHFRPEVTVIVRASLLPGNTERLTGEASSEEVDPSGQSAP